MGFKRTMVARVLSFALLSLTWLQVVIGEPLLESNSLSSCMPNSKFSASLFQVIFTPNNASLYTNINGNSGIAGNVLIEFEVIGYGYTVYKKTIDPCSENDLKGMCPMTVAPIQLPFNTQLPKDQVNKVPSAIYFIPDLDAKVQIWINGTDGTPLACVEAELSNKKSVNQKGVAWSIAVIAILGLVISAIVSGLGHSNAAAHVASSAMSLFSYFQAQAFIGMTAVTTPPIVRAWTQNFQWSMGIISVGFLQDMATWYLRATGGRPSSLLSQLATTSVQVQKRSLGVSSRDPLQASADVQGRSLGAFAKSLVRRTNSLTNSDTGVLNVITVRGIERVGFMSKIEKTNIFFTAYTFFIIFVLFVTLGVVIFKYVLEAFAKAGRLKPDRFQDFRNGWKVVLKGILFRVVLISFPTLTVLCLWELTVRDSVAEVVLAICTFITVVALLGWGSLKVRRLARRSIAMHRNPAYILYSNPKTLHKWGFLYVSFQASMYFFIIPVLCYILIKGAFIAFGQHSGTTQAIALLILEAALLITLCIVRPYMDKKTNAFNISIAAVNFFNVILLLFFTEIFNVPALAIGIMGVIFFIVNAVFSLVILLMTLWATVWAIVSKNPDTRYKPMTDDRGSFIKSQTNLATKELDALGATARGDSRLVLPMHKRMDLGDDDENSYSSGSNVPSSVGAPPVRPRPSYEPEAAYRTSPPQSPIDAGAPMLGGRPHTSQNGYSSLPGSRSQSPRHTLRPGTAPGTAAAAAQHAYRQQNSRSPWQTGVGY